MLSLRFKLTLYYLAILTSILLLFGGAIYIYLSNSLLLTIDESLVYQARKIEQHFAVSAGADVGEVTSENDEQLLPLSPHLMQIIDDRWQVRDEMFTSPAERLPVDANKLQRIEIGKAKFESIRMSSGESLRVVTLRARDHEGNGTYFIRLGQSLETLRVARKWLLIMLGVGIPIALLLGSYGGLYLANQALRPVDRITRGAEQIAAGDLSERVPVPGTTDEIGRLATTFNHMISRLEAAFERQKQFTSDASHELRTPLAVMRGDIEITLRRERSAEEYKRVLTSNLEEIVRLSRLVEDLLTLARADAGRVELRREPVDLDELCRKMVEYISPLAHQQEQTLSYDGPERAVTVNADFVRIKQLLLNLLDNAIKYTDSHGRIALGLRTENNEAVITVSDTGRGIPSEDLPQIFDRFFRRSAKTADRSASGFGLGLSIVKWIVNSHGGRIEAESDIGKGTTITVRLPLLET
jgi:heavy metal sensor kinase